MSDRSVPRAVAPWTWRLALRDHGPRQQGLLLTLYTLGTFMDDGGFAYPGQTTLARGARASVRTVRRHIDQAKALGWISVSLAGRTGQGWRHYVYRCSVPGNVPLTEKDEELADAVIAWAGDIERADAIVAAPSAQRADTMATPPSPKGADSILSAPSTDSTPTCGHQARERADIPSERADKLVAGNVRTELVPTNSCSETPASRTHAQKGALARTGPAFGYTDAERAEALDEALRLLPVADDDTIRRCVSGASLSDVHAARRRATEQSP